MISFITVLLVGFLTLGQSYCERLQVSERNTSKVFVELLRGRDGRDGLQGRDGLRGHSGPPGKDGKEGPPGPLNGAAIYTRWGSRSCPNGTELVYTGVTGGSAHNNKGGGANFLCMPMDPEYELTHVAGVRGHATIGAVGYRQPIGGINTALAACSVCQVKNRSTVIMIPAKANCPATWNREYYGYIMTEYLGSTNTRYMHECIDQQMNTIVGFQNGQHAVLLHHVETVCNKGLICGTGKYNNYKEMNCVVCSK